MADVTAGEVLGIKAPGAGETVRLPIMLLDTNGDPVTGVTYDAAGVTVEIAKPGAALAAWAEVVGAAFATDNWAEIGRGNYDIILSGDVAGEAAVLNTPGHLRIYVAFTASQGDTYLFKVVPADVARDDQWTDARAGKLETIAADVLAATVDMTGDTDKTVTECLRAAWGQGAGKWAIVDGVLYIYAPDGTTVLYPFALDDPTAPSSRTPI